MDEYDLNLEGFDDEVAAEEDELNDDQDEDMHQGFYGVQKSQNQLQAKILLFLSNYTIKSLFSGVSPPPTLQIGNFPAPISTMQA